MSLEGERQLPNTIIHTSCRATLIPPVPTGSSGIACQWDLLSQTHLSRKPVRTANRDAKAPNEEDKPAAAKMSKRFLSMQRNLQESPARNPSLWGTSQKM